MVEHLNGKQEVLRSNPSKQTFFDIIVQQNIMCDNKLQYWLFYFFY